MYSFSLFFSLSRAAICEVLHLLIILLPKGTLPRMYHLFEKYLPKADGNKLVYYCSNEACNVVVENDVEPCSICGTLNNIADFKKNGHFFIMLAIKIQISAKLNLQGHYLCSHFCNDNNISDIYNCTPYKSVEPLSNGCNISMTWNCGGVPLFRSSNNEV